VYVAAAVVAAVVDRSFQSDFCCGDSRVGCVFVASGEANESTLSEF